MAIEIKAPQFPESVADGTVATWYKKVGEAVKRDELLVDIETDKVVLEVVAPADGHLAEVLANEDDTIESQQVLAKFEEGAAPEKSAPAAEKKPATEATTADESENTEDTGDSAVAGPAARKQLNESGLSANDVTGTGPGGRITKEDVVAASNKPAASNAPKQAAPSADAPVPTGEREEKRVAMTRLRKRVAERLVGVKNETAMLTTFNEVNMKPIMDMRKHYQEDFQKAHGVKLGFMSFFSRACVEALKRFPAVNASIDADDIVYHGFYDVGIAVSTERGLVVPVIRDVDQKGLAEIENQIIDYGKKASDGKLSLDDMTGGTFTITNGGVFGSLLSTPILNPPQTAILGMHTIQQRPIAENGEVVIRPMMYLALSYDHRIIDGKEAVQFLVTVKQFIEDPARLLLDI